LAKTGNEASVHFFMGNLSGMRKEIFPSLEDAYAAWLRTGDTRRLAAVAEVGAEHWERVALAMMDLHRAGPEQCAGRIRELVDKELLRTGPGNAKV
jgi:hypothetical protein